MNPVREPVLHVDFVSLSPAAGRGTETILDAARDLSQIDSVLAVGAIEGVTGSDYDLAVYCLLPAFTDLEPFGTHPRYTRFLQGTIAPNLRSFSGASVRLSGPLRDGPAFAACAAVEAPEETYDWEIGERLASWAEEQPGAAVIGLAIGERQRYRGLALVFADAAIAGRPSIGGFEVTFVAGAARRLV